MSSDPEHIALRDLELFSSVSEFRTRDEENRIRNIQKHLSGCPGCASAAELHNVLVYTKTDRQMSATETCPPAHVWYELAGGLLSHEEAAELLAHTSQCSACSVALLEGQEDMGGPEIDTELRGLQSSTTVWQDELAHHLAAGNHVGELQAAQKPGQVVRFPGRVRWMLAVAAVLLLSVLWPAWKIYQASSDDALLAQAYDAQRRTDLRLPGGNAVPLASMNRGSGELPPPTQLLRLRLRAQEHLNRDANNPHWHVVLGRIALAENNGERAKQELETALALDSSLSGIKADLAAAYFEIGEGTGDPANFARATDLYGQILDHPEKASSPEWLAMLYLNRALSWDRQSIYHEAIKDYEQALKLERDRGWQQEIKRRLDADRSIEKKSESGPGSHEDRSSSAFLHPSKSHVADDEYELFLGEATRDWLPRAGASPEIDAALRTLAARGRAGHDTWLSDMLVSAKVKPSREAAEHLAGAAEANLHGSADVALSEAVAAAQLFLKANNKAGMLRAEVEQSYTLARQGRAQECLALADPLLQSHALEPYVWLHVYLLLNRATCSGATGDVEQFTLDTTEGLRIARAASLPLLVLRAEGFLVDSSSALGDKQTAWKLAQEGLRDCASHHGTRMSSYQFLESIRDAVEGSLPYTAAGVADAATHAAAFVSNLQVQAYAFELQGRAESAITHKTRAAQLFAQASSLLHSLPPGRAANLYQADWEADRAEWLAQSGHVADALQRLRNADGAVAATDNYEVRQGHDTEFARVLLLSGDTSGALMHATAATRDAEHALATIKGEAQRLAWERTNGRGYRLLVQALASRLEADKALAAWQWYRAASYRHSRGELAQHTQHDDPPQLAQLPPERLRTLTLIVGRIETEYIVWSVDSGPDHTVRMVHVPGPPQRIEEISRTLSELCADRNSSGQLIRAVGRELYMQLFGQLQQQLEQQDAVQLDLDRSLQDLPIASLVQPDGKYFGLAHTLIFLPAWWSIDPPAPQTLPLSPHVLLVEGRTTGLATRDGSRAMLAKQYLETTYLKTVFPSADVMRSPQANTAALERLLPEVDLFHYSGHTAPIARHNALLLGAAEDALNSKTIGQMSLPRLRLAVLATCSSTGGLEAGVNDTDSVTHALLRAGAANVIATLWDVDSESLRELMERLYGNLRVDHSTIAGALRSAQQAVEADVATAHPFYWASIQLFAQ